MLILRHETHTFVCFTAILHSPHEEPPVKAHRVLPFLALAGFAAACQDTPLAPRQALPGAPSAATVPLDSGYIMRDGNPMKVVFEIRGGRALFEGDIDLGPAGEIATSVAELRRRAEPETGADGPRLGVVTSNLSRRWNFGVVPYVIESTVPNQSRITGAIAHIEQSVHGMDFVPRTSQGSWIIFRRTTDPNICGSSPLGRQGGGQVVLINDSCGQGTAIHEILHSLGFWHEQSRCDRDSYVSILWNNIESGRSSQFDKYCSGASTVFAYDEGSIMHYPSNAFGIQVNGVRQQTIQSLRGLGHLMGQRSGLSTQDTYTIDWMYQPYAPQVTSVTYPGGTPTIAWNASSGAAGYGVNLVIVYEEYNDYENTSNVYDYTSDFVGSTTGLALQDTQHPYTGTHQCVVYSSIYGSISYTYWYEIYASYPSGVGSRAIRWAAAVAPASC